VHYSVPWGYWMFGATWSANRYRQTVFGPYASYLSWGTSSCQELSVARVVHRDGRSKTTASVEGFVRESNNFIDDLEVLVQRRRSAGREAGVQVYAALDAGRNTMRRGRRERRTRRTTWPARAARAGRRAPRALGRLRRPPAGAAARVRYRQPHGGVQPAGRVLMQCRLRQGLGIPPPRLRAGA
jgi:hypothetical protein